MGIEIFPTFYIQNDFSIFDVLLLLICFFVQYSTSRYACHGHEIRFGFIEMRIRSACDTRDSTCSFEGFCCLIQCRITLKIEAEISYELSVCKGKAIALPGWAGPEDSWSLRLPNFKTVGT